MAKLIKSVIGSKCVKGEEITMLRSEAGWYLGTYDYSEGYPCPNCRISEYFANDKELEAGVEYRNCPENQFCSNGRVCTGLLLESSDIDE